MGSAAILRACQQALIHPACLVLECPFDRLLSTVENRFTLMGLPSFPFARLLVFWGGLEQGFNGLDHNPREYARAVTCPTLFLHGEDDPRVTKPQAEDIFNQLSGPKHLELFEHVGHQSFLSARPERWKHCVQAFLSRLAFRSGTS
jgi:pimeloyl-ACP methyl ester carboxylesterase